MKIQKRSEYVYKSIAMVHQAYMCAYRLFICVIRLCFSVFTIYAHKDVQETHIKFKTNAKHLLCMRMPKMFIMHMYLCRKHLIRKHNVR